MSTDMDAGNADDKIDVEIGQVMIQKKEIDAKLSQLHIIDDDALAVADKTLNRAWDATHCFKTKTALWFFSLGMLALVGAFMLLLGTRRALGFPLQPSDLAAHFTFTWLALILTGLAHLPICAHRGPCGQCRKCPCSR